MNKLNQRGRLGSDVLPCSSDPELCVLRCSHHFHIKDAVQISVTWIIAGGNLGASYGCLQGDVHRLAESVTSFKSLLKTHFYRAAFK